MITRTFLNPIEIVLFNTFPITIHRLKSVYELFLMSILNYSLI